MKKQNKAPISSTVKEKLGSAVLFAALFLNVVVLILSLSGHHSIM